MNSNHGRIGLLEKLQESLIASTAPQRDSKQLNSFLAMLNPNDPLIYLNYAVPTAEATSADVAELVRHCTENQRVPRLEFFTHLWPNLELILKEFGFECEMKVPVMALSRGQLKQDLVSNVEEVTTKTDLILSNQCSSKAFGAEYEPNDAAVEQSLLKIAEGLNRCAAIKIGEIVASCGWSIGNGAICELAGVGTDPDYRKQGLASRVSAYLCQKHFDQGGELVWLSAGTPEAEAVYRSLGFETIGDQAHYSLH